MTKGVEGLLARVEAATGPDRKLDEAIAVWTYPELATYPRSNTGGWIHPAFGKIAPADGYTSSLDAALALAERALGRDGAEVLVQSAVGSSRFRQGQSLASAFALALLRSLLASPPSRGGEQ